jgi:P-type E1-E2 ATPase
MITIAIPGREPLTLEHAIFDLNGTLAMDGVLAEGVATRLSRLGRQLHCVIASADTHGTLERVAEHLGVEARRVERGTEKAALLRALRGTGAGGVVAVGNGMNDLEMFREADLAIAVLGTEGTATTTLVAADVICRSGEDAIDLLLHTDRLVATLRP